MSVSDEELMAFADGELSGAAQARVEAAIAGDAALQEKLAAHQRLRAQLSGAFAGALSEAVPARLHAAAGASAPVADLAARRAARAPLAWRSVAALAACVAVGVFAGVTLKPGGSLFETKGGGLAARGALERALETQLAAQEARDVRIGLTFRAHDGGYCRTFDLTKQGMSGLACRSDGDWTIAMLAAHAEGGDMRTAAAPAEVLSAVEARIDGEPLDAEGERVAREAHWR